MLTQQRAVESWVVYRMPIKGTTDGANAICTQSEWTEMEDARPGYRSLLASGIGSEMEAERLARGTSGDTIPRGAPRPLPGPAMVNPR